MLLAVLQSAPEKPDHSQHSTSYRELRAFPAPLSYGDRPTEHAMNLDA
jgi:hypothetical protein